MEILQLISTEDWQIIGAAAVIIVGAVITYLSM